MMLSLIGPDLSHQRDGEREHPHQNPPEFMSANSHGMCIKSMSMKFFPIMVRSKFLRCPCFGSTTDFATRVLLMLNLKLWNQLTKHCGWMEVSEKSNHHLLKNISN